MIRGTLADGMEILLRGETHFRYVLHQRGDMNREVTVAVLAFDVPSPKDVEKAAEDSGAGTT